MTEIALRALQHVDMPFDPEVEFTVEDAAKARGWSLRKARQVLQDEAKAGHLARRRVSQGYEHFYAYRMVEKPNGAS